MNYVKTVATTGGKVRLTRLYKKDDTTPCSVNSAVGT